MTIKIKSAGGGLVALVICINNSCSKEINTANNHSQVLLKLKKHWNAGDEEELYKLFHENSKVQIALLDQKEKIQLENEIAKLKRENGEILNLNTGEYNEERESYVLQFQYKKSGVKQGFIIFKEIDQKLFIHEIDMD